MAWGLLVLLLNVGYLLFSVLIGYLAYRFFRHKLKNIGKIVFVVVLLAPFWDLIIQKGVKTYYQTFKMEGEIYAYPEFDADGKIESLDITKKSSYTLGHFINYLPFSRGDIIYKNIDIDILTLKKFKSTDFDERIKNFLELKVFDDERIEKKLRVRFDNIKPEFEYIESGIARYKIDEIKEDYLFDLYRVTEYLLIDNNTNKILAKDLLVSFYNKNEDKFRNKYLLWVSANGIPFSISQVKSSVIKEKILKINYL